GGVGGGGGVVGGGGGGGEGAAEGGGDGRRLRPADVTLAHHVFVAVAGEGARAHGPRHVEITGVGTIRHRGPVGAADAGGLDQHRRLPERLEDAAVILVTGDPLGTLRDEPVAHRERLGVGRVLAPLLCDR